MVAASFLMLSMVSCLQFLFIISLLLSIWNQQSRIEWSTSKESNSCQNCCDKTQHSKADPQLLSQPETLQQRHDKKYDQKGHFSTSVYCTGLKKKDRECRFTNLCYNNSNGDYLFVHGPKSRMYGLPDDHLVFPLLDISSVDDHSAKYFSFKYVNSSDIGVVEDDVKHVLGSSILFHRFNPSNIMHVMHDDLIPLYHTQRKYFPSKSQNINFVMMDGRSEVEYQHLYELFSRNIFVKENFTRKLVCFDDVVVGLSKVTTWYQFGFAFPQGPINYQGFPFSELKYFTQEFKSRLLGSKIELQKLPTNDEPSPKKKGILVFSRSQTRMILNMGPLIFKLTSHFKLPVQKVDLEVDSFADIVTALSNSFIVIGVHGAHLVTSLFMPRGSILVEIFPYAVPSENYTPYKTLAKLMNLHYIPWENREEENTVTHEDWPPHLGGISGLPAHQQSEIRQLSSVPVHLCCKDPVWLFRIYQDTRVNVDDIIQKIDEKLEGISVGIT